MKCKDCSRVIPDGFTDCPWCGAIQAGPAAATPAGLRPIEPAISPVQHFLTAVLLLGSATLFVVVNYLAIMRTDGFLSLANSAHFLGKCAGSIILGAILVFLYYKIRHKKARSSVQLLVIFTVSSLLTLLTLAAPVRHLVAGPDPAMMHHFGDLLKSSNGSTPASAEQTIWDPAARSWYRDLLSYNKQYVSEVSKLDETAKPLYTVESFRDAATVQAMIDQLRARLAVADKYADWEPVFAKMKQYVAAVDASEEDKRKFMVGFESGVPKALAARKSIADKEHAWLHVSLDLYQFTLSKNGTYAVRNGNLVFKKPGDSDTFNQKLAKARTLQTEFLRAYWEVRHTQEAALAQMGLQGSEFDPNRPH